MSSVVKTKAKDGSEVEFVYQNPKQGGVKDVYFSPDKSYVVAFFRNPLDDAGKERLEKLVGTYRERIFNGAGGEYWKNCFRWPEKIVEYNGLTGFVEPAYDKRFFFETGDYTQGQEKNGKWFASAKSFNRFLPDEEKGNLLNYLKICLQLSRSVRRLHNAGLAHSDLSYKNCLIDPKTGRSCIIDVDGLVVPGLFPPDVLGTPDFLAPEVEASINLPWDDPNRKLPCRETDMHALAVLIYQYLLRRHPLRGGKIHSVDERAQEHLEMGEKALFVEHPSDKSNRPKLDNEDKALLPWTDVSQLPYDTTGPILKNLFTQAFIDGLHNPSKRPSADEWELGLVRTLDAIQPCPNPKCLMKWYVFDNARRPVCPYCGTPYRGTLPILDLYSGRNGKFRPDDHRLIVFDKQSIYLWHIDRSVFPSEKLTDEQQKRVGYFTFFNGRWLLVNEGMPSLKDLSKDVSIPTNKYVELYDGQKLQLSTSSSGRIAYVQIANN